MSSLTSWLRQIHAEHIATPREPVTDIYSLGLRELLQIHKRWRLQLQNDLLSGLIDNLDIERITCDSSCTLGQWLHGPGRQRFGLQPGWLAACRAHTRFHQCARELALAHYRCADELTLTRLEHELKDASSRSQLELVRLFGKTQ